MKKRIFGRTVGSHEPMVLLSESSGVTTGGQPVDAGVIDQFAIANTRRQIQFFRERHIEGYVLFENDPTRYEFSPEADFVYPSAIH